MNSFRSGGIAAAVPIVALGLTMSLEMLAGLAPAMGAEPFPYGRELMLDVNPMRGSKRVPILDVGENGIAEIELWCNRMKAQLVVAADTVTIITGEISARQCAPERARADDELIAALNQVTSWRVENFALVLTGGPTLRFRMQTN